MPNLNAEILLELRSIRILLEHGAAPALPEIEIEGVSLTRRMEIKQLAKQPPEYMRELARQDTVRRREEKKLLNVPTARKKLCAQ